MALNCPESPISLALKRTRRVEMLGRMDSNHNSETQILVSYHWTTSQILMIQKDRSKPGYVNKTQGPLVSPAQMHPTLSFADIPEKTALSDGQYPYVPAGHLLTHRQLSAGELPATGLRTDCNTCCAAHS